MNKITFTQYCAGAAVYCGTRKGFQLHNARIEVYDHKTYTYKKVPILNIDKLGIICVHAAISPYTLPFALLKDAKTLEINLRGLHVSDFLHDDFDTFWSHLLI